MKEMGTPFQEKTSDLLTLDVKIIATPGAGEIVKSHYQTEESHFNAFIGGIYKGDEGSFYDPIEKNKLTFFNKSQDQLPVI